MELDSLPPRERLELLSAYLDGELPAETAREVTAWLERRPDALREVEHQRRLWALLGRYADEPVPAGFARRVLDTVGSEAGPVVATSPAGTPRLRSVRRHAWAYAAAAAVLAAVGTGVFLTSRPGSVTVAHPGAEVLNALDADFVQHADLAQMANLSDDQFSILLVDDPDTLADGGTLGG